MNETITMDCGCTFEIHPRTGEIIFEKDFKKLKLECPRVWELFSAGNTDGVFQLESYLGKKLSKQLKPENIEHLAALIAIMRPGMMAQILEDGKSATEHFIKRKNREEPVEYIHESVKDILKETYGLLCYQESGIKIATDIAGMSLTDADKYIRKGVAKKKADVIAEAEERFLTGCKNTGIVNEATAKQIFEWIKAGQRYSFNKSHSVGYSMLSFLTAYAKAHFPHRFFRSYLSHAKSKQKPLDEISKLAYNARQHGIYLMTPDIRLRNKDFIIKGDAIYFGLESIKEIGANVLAEVLEELKNVDFLTIGWTELLVRHLINIKKTAVKRMIAVGCFDFFNMSRKQMLQEHENYLKTTKKERDWIYENADLNKTLSEIYGYVLDFIPENKKNKAISNKNRYTIIKGCKHSLDNPNTNTEDSIQEISNYEKSYLGIAITAHKIDAFNRDRSIYNCSELDQIPEYKETSIIGEVAEFNQIITSNGDEMAFVTIHDEFARCENIVLFPQSWIKNQGYIKVGNIVNFFGKKKNDGFIVDKCRPAELKR